MAKRIIPSKGLTAHTLEALANAALAQYRASGHANTDCTETAFLAGIGVAFKVASEIDEPWIARNIVSDAAERVCKAALRWREESAPWHT